MLIRPRSDQSQFNEAPPDWVTSGQLTERVWRSLQQLENEKAQFIGSIKERNVTAGKRRTTVSKREVADRAECSPSSLHNRLFSPGFELALKESNCRLTEILRARLRRLGNTGMKDRRKTEVLTKLRRTEKELKKLKNQQASKIVDEVFERLPLRVRRTLMLE